MHDRSAAFIRGSLVRACRLWGILQQPYLKKIPLQGLEVNTLVYFRIDRHLVEVVGGCFILPSSFSGGRNSSARELFRSIDRSCSSIQSVYSLPCPAPPPSSRGLSGWHTPAECETATLFPCTGCCACRSRVWFSGHT